MLVQYPDWILAISALGSSVLVFVVWLVRLEGKVKDMEGKTRDASKSIDKLGERSDALSTQIFGRLTGIETSIARIEGRLSVDQPKKGE